MAESNKPSLLVEQKRIEAILKNRNSTCYWEDRKKSHEEVLKSLEHYAGKLKENIMVPIGKRGLMRGKIINTNQIFVSLGAGWFSKVCTSEAQKVCSRRLQNCTNMLEKLEKERKLLEGWTALSNQQIFGTEEAKEIIEPYDEKEEKAWREQHSEKVKVHMKKLADLRKEVEVSRSKDKNTEEDLWKHLELLELQEEMEDELLRLGEDESSIESEEESATSTPLDSDDSPDERETEEIESNKVIKENELKSILNNINIKNKKNDNKIKDREKKVTFCETHSGNEKLNDTSTVKCTNRTVNNALGEVIEHSISEISKSENPSSRPVSKFKSSRMSNKN